MGWGRVMPNAEMSSLPEELADAGEERVGSEEGQERIGSLSAQAIATLSTATDVLEWQGVERAVNPEQRRAASATD